MQGHWEHPCADPPVGTGTFTKPEGGFEYAHELVTLLRELGGFGVAVAGFPEGHVECSAGRHQDWTPLPEDPVRADLVITQLFFDNDLFYEFRDYLVGKLGVTVPIVPGDNANSEQQPNQQVRSVVRCHCSSRSSTTACGTCQ